MEKISGFFDLQQGLAGLCQKRVGLRLDGGHDRFCQLHGLAGGVVEPIRFQYGLVPGFFETRQRGSGGLVEPPGGLDEGIACTREFQPASWPMEAERS